MQRCLQLAAAGAGNVAPNPMVGAVLVYNNEIIGEGYHMKYGEAHAEVNCIASVEADNRSVISQSTLYVSLEPCSHFGKTPPCADLIIENRIPHVVIGCKDPFEKVNGGGIEKLLAAGVRITTGILEDEAMDLNKRFFTFHTKQRPYIILKWAQSSNARIATGTFGAVKISNLLSDTMVHKWRSEESAIMVGFNTAKFDDPSLTNRLWTGNNPIRIVLDPALKLKASLQLFSQQAPTLVINRSKSSTEGKIKYCKILDGLPIVKECVKLMHSEGLLSVIVEGGTKLIQAFINEGYWDEIRVIENSELQIEDGITAPNTDAFLSPAITMVGSDKHIFFRNNTSGI